MGKAYVFCRFWEFFTERFPYERFNDLDESEIKAQLRAAAEADGPSDDAIIEWLKESSQRALRGSPSPGPRPKRPTPLEAPKIREYQAKREPPKNVQLLVRKLQFMGWLRSPVMWGRGFVQRHILAVAPSKAIARAVADRLAAGMDVRAYHTLGCPRFGVIEAASLPESQQLSFQLQADTNKAKAQDPEATATLFELTRRALDLVARASSLAVEAGVAGGMDHVDLSNPPGQVEQTGVCDAVGGNQQESPTVPRTGTEAEPEEPDSQSPCHTKARAIYEWALARIQGAENMSVAELYDAIMHHPKGHTEFLPKNAETFARYLRAAGVRRYDRAGRRRPTRSVRRKEEL